MKRYRHKLILLIDDSYIDNLINRKILENSDYAEQIVVKDTPQKAVDYLIESIANSQIPEVIFLDLRMPEMNGFEFLVNLNNIEGLEAAGTKIYVLSSSLDPKDFQRIKDNKLVSRFIGKPLTNQVLADI